MIRYYNLVTHRFINADGYFQSGVGVLDDAAIVPLAAIIWDTATQIAQ